jgi:hypothetical protein
MPRALRVRRGFEFHTTAALRRELHDPRTNRWMRGAIWGELQRRRRAIFG